MSGSGCGSRSASPRGLARINDCGSSACSVHTLHVHSANALPFYGAADVLLPTPPRSYVERMNEQDVKRAILVVQQGMTSFAKRAIVEICAKEPDLALECFQESELLVNITKHVLVPQHQVLTKEVRVAALPPSDAAAPRDAPARLCVAGEIHPTEAVQAEGCAAASDPAQRPRGEILRAKPWPGGQDRATQRDGRQIRHLPFGRLAASARPLARSLLFSSLCC